MTSPTIIRAASAALPGIDDVLVVRRALVVDDETHERMSATLSDVERTRVARYVFEHDRRSAAVSRGTLRELLASLLGTSPAALVFTTGPQGKPALVDRALEFNVSHSCNWLYLAVARARALGVDVEGGGRSLDVDELAPTVFTAQERAELREYAPADRVLAFLRGWTRKEAYVKVLGTGLSMPLADFSVSLAAEPAVTLTTHVSPQGASAHAICDLPAPVEHAAALAWERTVTPVARVVLVDASW